MEPAELSHQLRTGDGTLLQNRRRVLQLATGAAGFAALPAALPETRAALRTLRTR